MWGSVPLLLIRHAVDAAGPAQSQVTHIQALGGGRKVRGDKRREGMRAGARQGDGQAAIHEDEEEWL